MKTVVLYKSKTGFTKNYAEWLAKDLSADIFEASRIKFDALDSYDTVIFGGGLYAAGINGVKIITGNIDRLKHKKLVVFATGVSPVREDVINDVLNRNFTSDHLKHIKFFYLRGGFNYSRLNFFDKILMTLLKWKISRKKKEDLTDDEKGMLAVYDHPLDYSHPKHIKEIVDYVNSI